MIHCHHPCSLPNDLTVDHRLNMCVTIRCIVCTIVVHMYWHFQTTQNPFQSGLFRQGHYPSGSLFGQTSCLHFQLFPSQSMQKLTERGVLEPLLLSCGSPRVLHTPLSHKVGFFFFLCLLQHVTLSFPQEKHALSKTLFVHSKSKCNAKRSCSIVSRGTVFSHQKRAQNRKCLILRI